MSLVDANHELVRNFNAHGFLSSALRKAIFQEYRLPRVGHECAYRRQVNIGCAVAGFHALAYESRVASHNFQSDLCAENGQWYDRVYYVVNSITKGLVRRMRRRRSFILKHNRIQRLQVQIGGEDQNERRYHAES
jgi:hypothetical protein